ncbi:hypothetical protein D9M72_387890 [compost metagenome]
MKDRQSDDRALAAALFGHIDDAAADRLGGAADHEHLAIEPDRTSGRPGDADQRLHEFRSAGADETVETEDLAAAKLEIDVLELGRVAVARNGEHRRADHHFLLRVDRTDGAADHEAHQFVLADIGNQALIHHRSIAEDGVAIGNAEDLVELVTDEEDRLAVSLQPLDKRIEFVDFLVRQRCRRLVHDDHLGIDGKRAGDRDEMFLGNAEITQADRRIEIGTGARKQRARISIELLPVDQAEAIARCMAEEDVFGDRELIEKHGFLVDRGDAGTRCGKCRREMDLLLRNADRAAIRLIDAGQDLHQRRLSGAVFADQRGHRSRIERQRNIRERLDAGEGLRDPLKRDGGLHPRCERILEQVPFRLIYVPDIEGTAVCKCPSPRV